MKDDPEGMVHEIKNPFHQKNKKNDRKQYLKKDHMKGSIIQ